MEDVPQINPQDGECGSPFCRLSGCRDTGAGRSPVDPLEVWERVYKNVDDPRVAQALARLTFEREVKTAKLDTTD